jgi:hypothetical protein
VSELDEDERAGLADMDIHGSGLLQVAVYLGEVEVCKYFVEELGFDVNAGGLCGGMYFSYAILTPFLVLRLLPWTVPCKLSDAVCYMHVIRLYMIWYVLLGLVHKCYIYIWFWKDIFRN